MAAEINGALVFRCPLCPGGHFPKAHRGPFRLKPGCRHSVQVRCVCVAQSGSLPPCPSWGPRPTLSHLGARSLGCQCGRPGTGRDNHSFPGTDQCPRWCCCCCTTHRGPSRSSFPAPPAEPCRGGVDTTGHSPSGQGVQTTGVHMRPCRLWTGHRRH